MANLPTLYEYYVGGGISQGLSVDQPQFTLNNKNISIYSGSMHYFRVPNEYWRDRLRKMRAAGLNAVQTYVPWNLHEPEPGKYDFGQGGTDMQEFLNIEKFLKTAQEEDLFVIMRPGPFICAEFEFGGLPSWLLREAGIKVRTSNEIFMKHVNRYFKVLLTLLASYQFTNGGPIISFQVENEYGSTEEPDADPPFVPDKLYLEQLRQLMLDNNIKELLFTSDSPTMYASRGSLPSLFQTANFDEYPEFQFDTLKQLQGDKPSMATEYWAGWFQHWSDKKYVANITYFADVYQRILKYPASVNLYMFHGGTNWGFLNGANMDYVTQNSYEPDITSYDYGAPLTEFGNYTQKYYIVKNLLKQYNPFKTKLPDLPDVFLPTAHESVSINRYLDYEDIVSKLEKIKSSQILPMELLPINNNTGQKYGYIVYRKSNINIKNGSELIINDYVYDTINIYVNNKLITNNTNDLNGFGYWRQKDGKLIFDQTYSNATLDLMICNMGRNNFGYLNQFEQFKGLRDSVVLDGTEIKGWEIIPLEFKSPWIESLNGWKPYQQESPLTGAGLYEAELILTNTFDTFIDMSKWRKGMVIVNDFVLGRYWTVGIQQSLYLPAPLLKPGVNKILIFEEFESENMVEFSKEPIYFNNIVNRRIY